MLVRCERCGELQANDRWRCRSCNVIMSHWRDLIRIAVIISGIGLLLLCVACSRLLADGPAANSGHIQTHDLGKLTWHQAQHLNGQPVRVIFVVDSLPHDFNAETIYNAKSRPGVSGTVRFTVGIDAGDYKIGQRVEVEGVMRTRVIPGRLIDGQRFEAVQEVEVRDARAVSRP
jgi:hypothetical protein